MNAEKNLHRALRRGHVPGEEDAARRAWPLVMQAYADAPRRSRQSSLARGVLVPVALAAAIVTIALTPPGDAVATFVERVVGTSTPKAKPTSATTLPGGGRLLVAGQGGLFAVGAGRPPQRFFGDADQATWSAHGRFVAATRGIELIAVSLAGRRHWSLHHNSRILDPRWDPADGYRVVYRSGGSLWTVYGNGLYDRRIGPAWSVAPVFRPHAIHEVAYAKPDGAIVVLGLDSGREILHTAARLRPRALAWSPSGQRLLAVSPRWVWITRLDGHFLARFQNPRGTTNVTAAWSPRGGRYAVLRHDAGGAWRVIVASAGKASSGRTLLTLHSRLQGLLWSPDGRWIAVAAPHSDQWLFLRPDANGALAAIRTISGVKRRFGGGKAATLQGWSSGT